MDKEEEPHKVNSSNEKQESCSGSVSEERLESWHDNHKYPDSKWLYRGQRDTTWDLKTSLERCCCQEGIQGNERAHFERSLIREFRRAYHHYDSRIPNRKHNLEWLSLMQ